MKSSKFSWQDQYVGSSCTYTYFEHLCISSKYIRISHANIYTHTKAYILGYCKQSKNIKERLGKEEKFDQSESQLRLGDGRRLERAETGQMRIAQPLQFQKCIFQRRKVSLREMRSWSRSYTGTCVGWVPYLGSFSFKSRDWLYLKQLPLQARMLSIAVQAHNSNLQHFKTAFVWEASPLSKHSLIHQSAQLDWLVFFSSTQVHGLTYLVTSIIRGLQSKILQLQFSETLPEQCGSQTWLCISITRRA